GRLHGGSLPAGDIRSHTGGTCAVAAARRGEAGDERSEAERAGPAGMRASRGSRALASSARMDGPLCLIVNPHAGGGRALKLLPGVEAALRAQGRSFRVERTTSMEHARELARGARDAGELVAAMGGDGLTGAVAGELRDGTGVL